MSQIVTRKSHVAEDKEKRQTENPVKDMKKKLAANAEKEKQAAEKSMEKSAPNEKQGETSDKNADKKEKDKSIERVDKKEKDKITEKVDKKEKDKNAEKVEKKEKDKVNDKVDKKEVKTLEKNEKIVERSPEKKDKNDKKETPVEKERRNSKDKAAKPGHSEEKKKLDEKPKQNGAKALNGEQNGDTVSSEDEDLDIERDEMFPELTYEDSDFEGFEVPTPEGLPSRSYTRRSQSKEKKDALNSPATDRRLRSSDSPKPDKKDAKKSESPKKAEEKREKEGDATIEIAVEAEENEGEARKPDTNYSRSRVKVSPYRRSLRLADVTISSTAANYTGNNTTMEMDITETSTLAMDDAPESPYLAGLRNIRGRRSYKPLKEMNLRNLAVNRSTRSTASTSGIESLRPTGTVVGRKRKPENDAVRMDGEDEAGPGPVGDTKRPRLLYRFTRPFRTFSTAQRHAEIVGINTDLPLTAPVACAAGPFDPEAIKPETGAEATTLMSPPAALPELSAQDRQMDSRRCIVM